MPQTVNLVYFSPTHTTQQVVTRIAEGLGAAEVIHHDLTLPQGKLDAVIEDGVVILGAPVYAGRVPELFLQRISGLTARRLPAVLVALYGNREFEDALVELRDEAAARGFQVIAAGAFIGEHSYSTAERPIAAGRPDDDDLATAFGFGRQVADKLEQGNLDTPFIAGNVPYRERVKLGGVAPETLPEACTLCGNCAAVCPTGIITVSTEVTTAAENCVMCCACIKGCGFQARVFNHPRIEERRAMLYGNCRTPKTPQVFL